MEWCTFYNQNNPPGMNDICNYVGSELWQELNSFLEETYKIEPIFSYSKCSMQPGWNVKYKKGGKSLCTLYPMPGFFIALVVVGAKESAEVELLLPSLSGYTQCLYHNTAFSTGGRWLMIHVTEQDILTDVISLVEIRKKAK